MKLRLALLKFIKKALACGVLSILIFSEIAGAEENNAKAKEGNGCEDVVARIISFKGDVLFKRGGKNNWETISQNQAFCGGETVAVLKKSNAKFILSNDDVVHLNENTSIVFSSEITGQNFISIKGLNREGRKFTTQSEIEPEPPPASDKWRLKSGG